MKSTRVCSPVEREAQGSIPPYTHTYVCRHKTGAGLVFNKNVTAPHIYSVSGQQQQRTGFFWFHGTHKYKAESETRGKHKEKTGVETLYAEDDRSQGP
ncbi:hypothetical protein AGOR_G00191180 [Albula goreensis]|uniref:Uncharacterized protein n=1 Tax=Albula goreensis TaxID=1534307 RepID=A0A8T3CV84_9TELE|nr:hypothetical protein AGOR_G00191180 [Albula goreensis]